MGHLGRQLDAAGSEITASLMTMEKSASRLLESLDRLRSIQERVTEKLSSLPLDSTEYADADALSSIDLDTCTYQLQSFLEFASDLSATLNSIQLEIL